MTTIREITQALEKLAPTHYQESYDNAGLITGSQNTPVNGVLICLDSLECVIEEAIEQKCNLIVAHHPIIFKGLRQINGKNYVERIIIKAIKNDIAIYAIHTNLDNVPEGVNFKFANLLGLENIKILAPKNNHDKQATAVGSGAIGTLRTQFSGQDFLKYIKQKLNLTLIRHTKLLDKAIKTVAVCGGTGSFLLPQAIALGADVFVSTDFKYHEFFDADEQIVIADIGHYESEVNTCNLLQEYLQQHFAHLPLKITSHNTNPIIYT